MKTVRRVYSAPLVTFHDVNGDIKTVNDLPLSISRWTPSRKALVIRAVERGAISLEEVLERYDLSEEEYLSWADLYRQHGPKGLRTLRIRDYRNPTPTKHS